MNLRNVCKWCLVAALASRFLGRRAGGLGLGPRNYVWAPGGYLFVDGYWDYSIGRRGVLFAPVYSPGGMYARAGFSYSPATVIDLGVFTNHLFLRPQYQHYYFGDYYAANYQAAGFYPSYRQGPCSAPGACGARSRIPGSRPSPERRERPSHCRNLGCSRNLALNGRRRNLNPALNGRQRNLSLESSGRHPNRPRFDQRPGPMRRNRRKRRANKWSSWGNACGCLATADFSPPCNEIGKSFGTKS